MGEGPRSGGGRGPCGRGEGWGRGRGRGFGRGAGRGRGRPDDSGDIEALRAEVAALRARLEPGEGER